MKKNVKKVVLAYSGGLDTSVIIPWLKENYEGCEVIAFSADLGRAGYTPTRVHTSAEVHFSKTDAGFRVTHIHLDMQATVPGINEDEFQTVAEGAKKGCPISNLFTGAEITLKASLVK